MGKGATPSGTGQVEDYLRTFAHPFRAELLAVRAIILGASDKIAERIKWKVPSFYYRADLAAFHPRTVDRLHLVMVFPHGLVDDPTGVLEGDYDRRRMVYFRDMAEVDAKRAALAAIVRAWVALEDGK